MIYIFSVILALFVILTEYRHRKSVKEREYFRIEVRERLEEIEKYAYTDIRELLEFLDKVKLEYGKTRKN